MLRNMEKNHSNLKIINYGDNKFYNEFVDVANDEVIAGVNTCGSFFIEKELEVLSATYDLMTRVRNLKVDNKEELYDLTEDFRKTTADLMDLIQFVETNREILKHILEKIDKQTKAFENINMKTFFSKHYNREESTLKHFLEHPGLLRVYFQVKYIYTVLVKTSGVEGYAGGKNGRGVRRGQSLKEMGPEDVNMFDEKGENHENGVTRGKAVDLDLEISRNIKRIQAYLAIQSNFFSVHSEDVFKQLSLEVNDYCNIDNLHDKAKDNYNNRGLTKDEFIEIELEYENKDEKVDTSGLNPCYSMVDLWLVLIHTFLYIMPYYGLALTSSTYATALNLQATLSGILQAATPIAAILGGFLFNYITWSNRYRGPYFFSLSLMFIGMVLYYIPYTLREDNKTLGIILLVIGRMSFGIGGSRLMTRKYLALNVAIWAQSRYSTIFVAISALAMCLGPGLAAVLIYAGDVDFGPTDAYEGNIMAFMFIFVYAGLLITFIFFFDGYDKKLDQKASRLEFGDTFLNLNQNEFEMSTLQGMKNKDNVGRNRKFKVSHLPRVRNTSQLSNSNLDAFKNTHKQNNIPVLKAYFPNGMTVYTIIIFTIFKSKLISDPGSFLHRTAPGLQAVLRSRRPVGRILPLFIDLLRHPNCPTRSIPGQEDARSSYPHHRYRHLHHRYRAQDQLRIR